jgi:hypothetical protein
VAPPFPSACVGEPRTAKLDAVRPNYIPDGSAHQKPLRCFVSDSTTYRCRPQSRDVGFETSAGDRRYLHEIKHNFDRL